MDFMFARPLEAIFGSSRARVLETLLAVDDDLSVRHIAQLADISPSTASEALVALEAIGLVSHEEVGRSHLYRFNREHVLAPALLALGDSARDLDASVLQRLLDALGGPDPDAVILFGSAARGEAAPESDLDLLVVGSREKDLAAWRERRPEAEAALRRLVGRPVHVALATRPTVREARTSFWRNVRRDGRALLGPDPKTLVRG